MIKFLLSHPIQYQSSFFRYLHLKNIKFEVIYRSDISLKKNFDKDFNLKVKLSDNLLDGYKSSFLKYIGTNKVSFFYPINTNFIKKLFTKDTKIIVLYGSKLWINILIIFFAKFKKVKIILRDEFNNLRYRSYLNKIFNKIYFFILRRLVDYFLSVGSENTKALKYYGVPSKKIFLMPWAVNNKEFYCKKKIFKKLNILFVGKLIPIKGCHLLLNAIKELNKYKNFKFKTKIKIIGNGILKNDLTKYKQKYKLTNVIFEGFKNQDEIKKYYRNSNLLVLPSYKENWGLVVNEAMASKNIIIVSNKVGCGTDLVKNYKNGFIFNIEKKNDLINKIKYIFNNNKKKNILMSNYSKKIISNWSFDQCYSTIIKLIKYDY